MSPYLCRWSRASCPAPSGDAGTEVAAIGPYIVSSAACLLALPGRETRIDGNLALPLPSIWLSTFPLCLLPISCLSLNLGTGQGEGSAIYGQQGASLARECPSSLLGSLHRAYRQSCVQPYPGAGWGRLSWLESLPRRCETLSLIPSTGQANVVVATCNPSSSGVEAGRSGVQHHLPAWVT